MKLAYLVNVQKKLETFVSYYKWNWIFPLNWKMHVAFASSLTIISASEGKWMTFLNVIGHNIGIFRLANF